MLHDKSTNELVTDPVCGMTKPKSEMKAKLKYRGRVYYFCYEGDKQMFEAFPERWLAQAEK